MEGTIWEYRYTLLFIMVVFIFYQFEWQRSKAILFALMLQAKRFYQNNVFNSGREQEDWVIDRAMAVLPLPVRIFISKNVLRSIVHEMYNSLQVYCKEEKRERDYFT